MYRPKSYLMIPGPIELEPEVLSEMARPMLAHYGAEEARSYHETVRRLKEAFRTEGDVFIVVGSGSGGLDAAFGSLLGAEGRALILVNGHFGNLLVSIARSYTRDIIVLEEQPGRPVDLERVRETLKKEKPFDLVAIVHCETSCGIMNLGLDIWGRLPISVA